MWVALDGVPALLHLEVSQNFQQLLLLGEEEGIEVLHIAKLVALVPDGSEDRQEKKKKKREMGTSRCQ